MTKKKAKDRARKKLSEKLLDSTAPVALNAVDEAGFIRDLEDGLSFIRHNKKMPDDVQKNFDGALRFFSKKFLM